ncbi:2-C-methyl-D-erythritol 4-phosphate cytidylyltransferase [Desulfitobacterium metallireducens]|uniref:2-C-methyl-D-erythritol 4-phosphate cytidylyltransferase n=1 Tax=Desulfitobacterium metallireducens DSM 15288 TaxID=871968 RepID=W0E536_9FIRM|nr:2-C-methyl-D-erythritol 4-phosphate cytidylyltransferase [Desulfitobacterium metallireducens]AHF05872.1 2-C-methyl-D-erythritol 4-phosphate cytidylyltransferase [Desulfitobacterium metallireducens DSM 15288]
MARIGVVIPAAGQGKRMGAACNKLFLALAGRPILAHTLALFEASSQVEEIVVVGSEEDLANIRTLIQEYQIKKVSQVTLGGKERQESVFAGVKALNPAIQRVAVHDGARPLLTLEELNRFFTESEEYSAAIMAIPLKDTIKRVDEKGQVLETPPRERLRAVQTPQIFERELLEDAHRQCAIEGFLGTDDASLVEWLGKPVQVLDGMLENIKITTPEDLWIAESILKKRLRKR